MTNFPKQKIYCYVDETGQDTQGQFFIVSVIVTGEMRDRLGARLEEIEKATRKGNVKWIRSRSLFRLAYMKAVLSDPLFKNTLHFSHYEQTKKYMVLTVLATARAIATVPDRGVAAVYVDGLPKSRVQWFSTELRRLSVRTSKVVGVRKEESDAFIRLADAYCGFVRQALMAADEPINELFEQAKKQGYLKEL